ncbi:hypothetical protein [Microbispora sp. NPDC049125]|uniref:hypothetical protein n=1 Tax=Microbispora sp. NPDC049125 TaxID=3154929 RepID=UPI003466ECE4
MTRQTNPKVFNVSGAYLPGDWAEFARFPHGRRQGSLFVIAWTKRDAAALLAERGVPQHLADALTDGLRWHRQPQHLRALAEGVKAGALTLEEPGVYYTRGSSDGEALVRVECEPRGALTVIGRFVYDRSEGMTTLKPVAPKES